MLCGGEVVTELSIKLKFKSNYAYKHVFDISLPLSSENPSYALKSLLKKTKNLQKLPNICTGYTLRAEGN